MTNCPCPAALFAESKPVVEKTARLFAMAGVLDYEEFYSEGLVEYVLACREYDGGGGSSFRTWLINRLRWRFNKMVRGKWVRTRRLVSDPDRMAHRPWAAFDVGDFGESLGDDARLVASMLLNPPGEGGLACSPSDSPCKLRGMVKKALASRGWTVRRTKAALDEVGDAVAAW